MTITELRKIAAESGLSHARFCLEQEATQVGRDKLSEAFRELDKLEREEFNE